MEDNVFDLSHWGEEAAAGEIVGRSAQARSAFQWHLRNTLIDVAAILAAVVVAAPAAAFAMWATQGLPRLMRNASGGMLGSMPAAQSHGYLAAITTIGAGLAGLIVSAGVLWVVGGVTNRVVTKYLDDRFALLPPPHIDDIGH